mgnify:CR=1 FL=1
MHIRFSLSGFTRGSGNPFDIYSKEFTASLIGVPVYLDRYKHVGRITAIDPKNDWIYAQIDESNLFEDWVLETKGYNSCSFEIV